MATNFRAKLTQRTIPRATDPLSMQIYSAMLGDEPRIERLPREHRPRLTMRVRVEARLEHRGTSPFRKLSLRDHIERCAGYAVMALDEARERFLAAKPAPITATPKGVTLHPMPIVLIGPVARRKHVVPLSRAA